MGIFNGNYVVELKYRREGGNWVLKKEHIDGEIRNRDPYVMARVTAIDLPLACSGKRGDSPEVRRNKGEAVPRKHVGLLTEALVALGLYPKSMHEKSSGGAGQDGEEYNVFIAVEETSPPCLHVG
jgi:hypothetical protein